MFGLGLAGMWFARRRSRSYLAMIYFLTMPIPFYLTWALLGRFRFPIEPILILFAAHALMSLASSWAPRFAGEPEPVRLG
jgi:hypothetical protein